MKKFVNKKVPQRSNKKVMSKKNKNTLYAYLLLAAFAIWTICSVLGVIAFFRTQRSAGIDMITAGAEEVLPTADSSDIPKPSSRLFDLVDSAVWHLPSVSYGKEFTPTYESNGLFSFDNAFKTVFAGEDALTNDAGRNWCGFNFSLQKRVTVADLAFNIFYLADDSVARSNILGLEVVISDSTVVSFAFEDDFEGEIKIIGNSKIPVMLGDIYISYDKAVAQASDYGHSVKRELSFLFVHGLLHLLGYDHMVEEDKKVMRSLEEEILNEYDIKR